MHNFSDQCLDLARSLLGNNLQHINEDGTVTPAPNEESRVDEPGHAALAIGEFFRATGEVELGEYDLFDLSARCVTQQAFTEEANDNGFPWVLEEDGCEVAHGNNGDLLGLYRYQG